VERACDALLARAGLAGDENRQRPRSHALCPGQQLPEGGRFPDQLRRVRERTRRDFVSVGPLQNETDQACERLQQLAGLRSTPARVEPAVQHQGAPSASGQADGSRDHEPQGERAYRRARCEARVVGGVRADQDATSHQRAADNGSARHPLTVPTAADRGEDAGRMGKIAIDRSDHERALGSRGLEGPLQNGLDGPAAVDRLGRDLATRDAQESPAVGRALV